MSTQANPTNGANYPADLYRLRLPGPVAVPEQVRAAIGLPVVSHRGPEFRKIWGNVIAKVQSLFGTRNEVHLFACSGTGVMEAALLNIVARGERILVVQNGQWGERFTAIGRALGAIADGIDVPWGENVDLGVLRARLREHDYRALVVVHNESSTGVAGDLAGIGSLTRDRETLLIADTVSGLAGMELRQDEWGVDILVAGSQKALMCPPGLGLMSVSNKAWKVIERDNGMPRFYFDLRRSREAYAKGEAAFTPAVSLVQGLDVALDLIHGEGIANVLERYRKLSRGLKAGADALGLRNFATAALQSNTVAVFRVPDGLDGALIVRRMYEKHCTVIAGARNRMAGRMIRLGTMGAIGEGDILTDLLELEGVLADLGVSVKRGAAVAAAAAAF